MLASPVGLLQLWQVSGQPSFVFIISLVMAPWLGSQSGYCCFYVVHCPVYVLTYICLSLDTSPCFVYRLVKCRYQRIGCPWQGPYHELQGHQTDCSHPNKSGEDIMDSLALQDNDRTGESILFNRIFRLLSFEKIAFNGRQQQINSGK